MGAHGHPLAPVGFGRAARFWLKARPMTKHSDREVELYLRFVALISEIQVQVPDGMSKMRTCLDDLEALDCERGKPWEDLVLH
jgi:hypothetical protein